jgi:hypothetical protein
MLADRGVDAFRAEDIVPGTRITPEMLRHLEAADFVCALIGPDLGNDKVFFELGAAHQLRKPVLLLDGGGGHSLVDLARFHIVKADLGDLAAAADAIDLFLRHARPSSEIEEERVTTPRSGDLAWAHEERAALHREHGRAREQRLARLVGDLFRSVGAEVVATEQRAQVGPADLTVWLDDVTYDLGGPIIVECMYYGGGSGSVLMNSRHTVERLERYTRGTEARLALLVVDHDRGERLPALHETPQVLVVPIEELIGAIERGTLASDILERRRRAALVTVAGGGAD